MADWFLDKKPIVVNKEMTDDPVSFLSPNVTSVTDATSNIPFVTDVACSANDDVLPFNEDMIVYEFEPVYQKGDSIQVLRFRGVSTGNVYVFFNVKPDPNEGRFYDPPEERSVIDQSFFADSPSPLCKCTSTSLQILVYNFAFNLINPLLLAEDPTIFSKPNGPPTLSTDLQRFGDDNKGVVQVSNVPYFSDPEGNGVVKLLGGIGSAPIRAIPATTTPGTAQVNTPATQKPKNAADQSTQDSLGEVASTRLTPEERAAKNNKA